MGNTHIHFSLDIMHVVRKGFAYRKSAMQGTKESTDEHPPDSASLLLLDKTECLMDVGRMYLQRGEANKATEYLENALEQAKNSFLQEFHFLHANILYWLAFALEQDGKLEESLQYFDEAKKANDQISGSMNACKLEKLISKGMHNVHYKLYVGQECSKNTLIIRYSS